MTLVTLSGGAPRPRWDGSRILFDITRENRQIACAISRAALEDIGGRRCRDGTDLLRCFAASRVRIETMVDEKLLARPAGVYGRLNLWADDVDESPPADDDSPQYQARPAAGGLAC